MLIFCSILSIISLSFSIYTLCISLHPSFCRASQNCFLSWKRVQGRSFHPRPSSKSCWPSPHKSHNVHASDFTLRIVYIRILSFKSVAQCSRKRFYTTDSLHTDLIVLVCSICEKVLTIAQRWHKRFYTTDSLHTDSLHTDLFVQVCSICEKSADHRTTLTQAILHYGELT